MEKTLPSAPYIYGKPVSHKVIPEILGHQASLGGPNKAATVGEATPITERSSRVDRVQTGTGGDGREWMGRGGVGELLYVVILRKVYGLRG